MLRIDRSEASLVLTIDRAETKNALDYATMTALGEAMRDVAKDTSVRTVIVTGAGSVFASGGDLRELRDRMTREDGELLSDAGFTLCRQIDDLPVPVIAALPGPAIGGGAELALACDLRVADPAATIALRQVRLGVTTAWGTAARLVALAGASRAAFLLYTGVDLDAASAMHMGLVDVVTDDGDALSGALALAREIAKGSPAAVTGLKRVVKSATAITDAARAVEREVFVDAWAGQDHAEGVAAYFERRSPAWKR